MNKRTKEVCEKIGQYYLQKNNGDYSKTADDILALRISKVATIGNNQIIIFLSRIGRFIGKRGENIDALEKFLDMKVYIVEDDEDVNDFIIPCDYREIKIRVGNPDLFEE